MPVASNDLAKRVCLNTKGNIGTALLRIVELLWAHDIEPPVSPSGDQVIRLDPSQGVCEDERLRGLPLIVAPRCTEQSMHLKRE